jgi:hypothetical protein
MRLVAAAAPHRTIGLARRGNSRRLGPDFGAPRRTPGIPRQWMFPRGEREFFAGGVFLSLVWFGCLFHNWPGVVEAVFIFSDLGGRAQKC